MSFKQIQVGDIIRYEHEGIPNDVLVEIVAFRCRQKGKSYFISNMNAMHIDMLTTVPKYDFTKEYKDMAQDILEYGMQTKNVDKWQRETIEKNMINIDYFWANENNHIVNNVVIALKENVLKPVLDTEAEEEYAIINNPVAIDVGSGVNIMGVEVVEIKIHNWFSNVCPNGHRHPIGKNIWFDSCPIEECEYHRKPWRPAIIIDGQHRIRGSQFEESRQSGYNTESIPITILGPTDTLDAGYFRHSDMAKVFTEISAKAISLEDTHKIFLLYSFKTKDATHNMEEGSTERKAYETILRLAGTGISSPFENKIKILKASDNSVRRTALSFDRALRWFEDWYKHCNIWENTSTYDASNEIVNYVNSIRSIWAGRTPLGNLYWQPNPPPAKGGIFSHGRGGEMSSYLRVMLDVYPILRENVPAATVASFTNYIKKRMFEHQYLGTAHWDGEGWESIRSPDSKYAYLKKVMEEIMENDPEDNKIIEDIKSHNVGSDLNSYLNQDPSVYDVEISIENVDEKQSKNIITVGDDKYRVENGSIIKLSSRIGPFKIKHWVPFLHSQVFYYVLIGAGQEEKAKRVEPCNFCTHKISIPRTMPSAQDKIILELRGENHKGKQTDAFKVTIKW